MQSNPFEAAPEKRPLKFGQSFLHPTDTERQYFFGMARIFLRLPPFARSGDAAGFGYFG